MLKFFAILFIAVWAVKADDLLDLRTPQRIGDNSVSGSHSDRNNSSCCVGDKLNPVYSKQMQALQTQCAFKWRANNSNVEIFDPFDCERMTGIKKLIICEEECFARAINQIDESGQFNREAVKQHYAQLTVGDIEWKKASLDRYIDYCLAQVTANIQEPQRDQQCSSAALLMHQCMWIKFRSGCPVELRVNSSTCNKMRELLSQASDQLFYRQLFLKFLHKTSH